jgi:SIR2-like domain
VSGSQVGPAGDRLRRWTFFVGAGISRNSGCPLFGDFWEAYLARFATKSAADLGRLVKDKDAAALFPPEQLFYRLASLGSSYERSINATLLRYLSGRPPNRNHVVLARALQAGAAVWTTNYDLLIERAAEELAVGYHVLAWPGPPDCDRPGCQAAHIYKPHGSFGGDDPRDQRLIYQSPDVLGGLRNDWERTLRRNLDLRERQVVLAGYSGNDIDILPVIVEAARGARQDVQAAVWYEGGKDNIDRLKEMLPRSVAVEKGNPSVLLQHRCLTLLELPDDAIPSDPEVSKETPEPVALRVTHLATAILLDHFDQPRQARAELWRSVALGRDPVGLRLHAVARLTRGAAFDIPPVNRVARAVTRSLSWTPLPALRRRAWRNYLLFNETAGTSRALERQIQRYERRVPVQAWDFASRVSAASHAKLLGDLVRVGELIGSDQLGDQPPSMRGKAAYNLLWALRYQGRIEEWQQVWDEHVQRAALLDPNWAAWLRLEESDLRAMLGDGPAASAALATRPIRFAETRRRHPLLRVDADASRIRADVARDGVTQAALSEFQRLLERVHESAILNTGFRRASFELSLASLLPASHSSRSQTEGLLASAERRSPSALHLVLAGLLRRRHRLTDPPEQKELLAQCHRLGFGYGEALIIRELELGDELAMLPGTRSLLGKMAGPTPRVWVVP